MPFTRPSLSELRTQAATDINAALPGVDALLRYSNLGILGEVLAALTNGHYGYIDWIALNSVPFTATGEFLEGWAALKGVFRKPAVSSSGTAAFAAAAGAVIPSGTIISRSDGVSYFSTAEAIGVDGTAAVPIAAVDGGAGANAPVDTALTLSIGISGVTAYGKVSTAITGGADIELDADLRSRMLSAYATPPQGGTITDYPAYALAVPGVTRAWIAPSAMGPGTLVILFMMDVAQAANGGFPQGTNGCSTYETRDTAATGDMLVVANAIFPKQSVTALVYAVAPLKNLITITIAGLGLAPGPDTKEAIANAIRDALVINAVPGGLTNLAPIESAIEAVPGTTGFVVTKIEASAGTVTNGEIGNILSNVGTLPTLAEVIYT